MFHSHLGNNIEEELSTKKILLIEDDPDDVYLFKVTLKKISHPSFNYQFEHYDNVEEALNALSSNIYDVVFLDLSLPGYHGPYIVENVIPQVSIPVIVMTGYNDLQMAKQSIRLGAQDYLIKGQVNGDLLDRAIVYAMERKNIDQLKDQFISTVSHEIRTPLSIIKAAVSNLNDGVLGELEPDQKKAILMLDHNVLRLTRIIENLLDISRLQSGSFKPHIISTNLNQLINQVIEDFTPKVEKTNIKIKSNLSKDLPLVNMDTDMVIQLITNILSNAFRYANSVIEIETSFSKEEVKVIISNDGPSLSSSEKDKIFDRFTQINRPVGGRGYKGTGLGLPISKLITELLNGKIGVESENNGVSFFFTLPITV
jgi:signal transduction histidine kinase